MNSNLLHVVCCVFNPMRWQSRIELYDKFETHILESGVNLTTVECQLGERPFLLNNPKVNHVKVRSHTVLFNKENLINLGVASVTQNFPDWKYIMLSDADIHFRNPGWASEVVQALQSYYIIQPWSRCLDLGPQGQVLYIWDSFCKQFVTGAPMSASDSKHYSYAHSGYAWAYTRQALEWLGGLIETAALGAADHHMAWGLLGHAEWTIPDAVTLGYKTPIMQWQNRAVKHIHENIGFIPHNDIEHSFHGSKDSRGYKTRWSIIIDNKFDPSTDLMRNIWQVLELTGNKPKLQRELLKYMLDRGEDGNII